MSRSVRVIVGTAAVALTFLGATRHEATAATPPSSARFHLALSKSEPAANDSVSTNPKTIKLWFTETVQAAATSVRAIGPDARAVTPGVVTVAAAAKSPAVATVNQTL